VAEAAVCGIGGMMQQASVQSFDGSFDGVVRNLIDFDG
jgi:hypothetical protein